MTVDWLLQILSGNSIGNYPDGDDNNNNNNNNRDQGFPDGTKGSGANVFPIVSGGIPQSPGIDPFSRDALEGELKLPTLPPGYPAFFILILLVSLTTFAIFLLLALCCIHPSKVPASNPDPPPTPASTTAEVEENLDFEDEDIEEIYVPTFTDVATSPTPPEEDPEEGGDDENNGESSGDMNDTIVIEAEDPADADVDDTVVIEAQEAS